MKKPTKKSRVFETNDDINQQTKRFLKLLKGIVHKSFKKVKIRKDKQSEYQKLYNKWTSLRNKEDENSQRRSKEIKSELSEKILRDHLKGN